MSSAAGGRPQSGQPTSLANCALLLSTLPLETDREYSPDLEAHIDRRDRQHPRDRRRTGGSGLEPIETDHYSSPNQPRPTRTTVGIFGGELRGKHRAN